MSPATRNTVYGDLPIDEALEFEYRIMNYRERGYEELPYTGLSPDYVYRETKRSVEGAKGTKTQIWPGIDVDISNMDPELQPLHSAGDQRSNAGRLSRGRARSGNLTQIFRNETGESGSRRRRAAGDEDRLMKLADVIDIHAHCGPDSMARRSTRST